VVVPTCRPEKFAEFLDAWTPLFRRYDVWLFVIEDAAVQSVAVPSGISHELHCWTTIGARHIPHGTDMVRSWGIYRAWKHGCEFTLTLDDDVRPMGEDPFAAYERVFREGAPCSPYVDVGSFTSYLGQLRGFPFGDRKRAKVAVQYGGWTGVLDYDAPTQLAGVKEFEFFDRTVFPVPRGAAVTGCIMNAAWRTEYAPIMWQLPLLDGKFNRFGDIWSALFAKRVLDAEGAVMVVNGEATVRHERASDPVTNLGREAPGIPVNEGLWGALEEGDYQSVTDSAYRYFKTVDHDYAQHFLAARDEWLRLYD
jgi:hypothetical protein